MSSILDALRKHERDGDPAAQAAGPGVDVPMTAEQELAGYRPQAPSRNTHHHPVAVAFLAAAAGAAFVLVAVAAGTALVRGRADGPGQGVSQAPLSTPPTAPLDPTSMASATAYEPQNGPKLKGTPPPLSSTPPGGALSAASLEATAGAVEKPAVEPVYPGPSTGSKAPTTLPAEAQRADAATPEGTAPAAPHPAAPEKGQAVPTPRQPVAPAVIEPEPEPMAVARAPKAAMIEERIALPELKPEPKSQSGSRPAAAPAPERSKPENVVEPTHTAPAPTPQPAPDVSALPKREAAPREQASARDRNPSDYPRLSQGDAERLGLPDLRINVLSPPSEKTPTGSVMVNYIRLYPGDIIPKTGGAKVIGISLRGFALEVAGERFFVPRRR